MSINVTLDKFLWNKHKTAINSLKRWKCIHEISLILCSLMTYKRIKDENLFGRFSQRHTLIIIPKFYKLNYLNWFHISTASGGFQLYYHRTHRTIEVRVISSLGWELRLLLDADPGSAAGMNITGIYVHPLSSWSDARPLKDLKEENFTSREITFICELPPLTDSIILKGGEGIYPIKGKLLFTTYTLQLIINRLLQQYERILMKQQLGSIFKVMSFLTF